MPPLHDCTQKCSLPPSEKAQARETNLATATLVSGGGERSADGGVVGVAAAALLAGGQQRPAAAALHAAAAVVYVSWRRVKSATRRVAVVEKV